MPKKRGRKPRSTHRPPSPRAAASSPRQPTEMLEAEAPRSRSPSPSPSRSPSPFPYPPQPPDHPPEQHQPEPMEATQDLPPEQAPQDAEEEEEESQGAPPSSPRVASAAPDTRAAPNASVPRRPLGKRSKPLSDKQRVAIREKLDLLEKNLRPVPFAPGKAVDFARHEPVFRALGLWEFAHADLGGPVRADLLAQLIATYEPPPVRRGWVNGARISVSRPDLARALGLPWKKEKAGASEGKDAEHELFACGESIGAVMEFMSNWVLLHEEDACILPGEVVAATQLVRDGQAQKVDWSALIWTMVEKELLEVPTTGVCYYASHLQCLMRHQKPGIFEGEEKDVVEVPIVEEEDANVVGVTSADANVAGVTSTGTLQDSEVVDAEKEGAGLCLALGGDEGVLKDDVRECQENEQDQWFHGAKEADGNPYLRRCNLNDDQGMDSEDVAREEVEIGDEGRYVDDIATKFPPLDVVTSTDLLHVMGSVNVPYCLPLQPMEPLSGQFLVSRGDSLKSVELDNCMGGSSLFKVTGKREIDEVDDDDEGEDISHFNHGNRQKRVRADGQWDQAPLTIDKCTEEAQGWMEKAKMLFSQREQEFVSAQVQIQYVTNLLQQKDHQFQFLEKTRLEEQHRRQMEICRFEHELGVMARIVQGYRKALMETRRAFAEYRKQFPQGDEQLYKDDDDGKGLVITAKELERKRLQKEEARRLAVQMVDDFGSKWSEKFNDYENQVHQLHKRLLDLMEESNLLKERHAKNRVSPEKEGDVNLNAKLVSLCLRLTVIEWASVLLNNIGFEKLISSQNPDVDEINSCVTVRLPFFDF